MSITKREILRNSAARECLLDMADCDYLAARGLWRLRLPDQFLWSALQAVEKLMKAVLLFNDRDTRGINHNVEEGLVRLQRIQDMPMDLPAPVRKFLKYINRNGPNRYKERPVRLRGEELLDLDRCYWHLRRYCQDFRSLAAYLKRPEEEWLRENLAWLASPELKDQPHRFRLQGGYLEDVLDHRHGPEQYETLVWKNFFYGKRKKGTRVWDPLTRLGEPPHYRHPEGLKPLSELLHIPKDVASELGEGRS